MAKAITRSASDRYPQQERRVHSLEFRAGCEGAARSRPTRREGSTGRQQCAFGRCQDCGVELGVEG